ncbi:MAG: hypothetical protein LBV71_03610 [Prevotella sp.]|jgi:hypothetical protein|nr:hypothetical protein [Prevotella sp.]
MNQYKFILLGETVETIVQVNATDYLKASIKIIGWITSNPQELENMRYHGITLIKRGRPLIFIKSYSE